MKSKPSAAYASMMGCDVGVDGEAVRRRASR